MFERDLQAKKAGLSKMKEGTGVAEEWEGGAEHRGQLAQEETGEVGGTGALETPGAAVTM